MDISYFRSSSYNRVDFCEQCYFIEYGLGWSGKSGQKADKGTIVHKILEILALAKLASQNNQEKIVDEGVCKICGRIPIKNKSENKSGDKWCISNYYIDKIIDKVYTYYSTNLPHHEWKSLDRKHCHAWTWKALKYNGGQFNPLERDIVAVEPFFDIPLEYSWALLDKQSGFDKKDNLNKKNKNSEKDSEYLSLKGTIDLVTSVDNGILEVVDWKTGQRKDWNTGEPKTQESLYHDPQVRIYHYAIHHLAKILCNYDMHIDQVIITIFYINDGGPFSIVFDKNDLAITEKMIQKQYEKVKNIQVPQLNKTWKCRRLCNAGKNTFTEKSSSTQCQEVQQSIKTNGIAQTMKRYTRPGYNINSYKNPGEIS